MGQGHFGPWDHQLNKPGKRQLGHATYEISSKSQKVVVVVELSCCFTSTINIYGHVGTVSQPNHTFPGQA